MVTDIPTLPTHSTHAPPPNIDAVEVARSFLSQLSSAADKAKAGDGSALQALFASPGYWRDVLAFSREFRTFSVKEVAQAAADTFPKVKPENFALSSPEPVLESPFPDVSWIRVHFSFSTATGPSSGIARLVYESGAWKAYTLYTLLEEVSGFPQQVGRNRPVGSHNSSEPHDERRAREVEFLDADPEVLIIGGGHNGLACSAVLRSFGVKSSLIVDRFSRVGDNWRKRYASLSLHDPVWTDHMPLMPYPPNWPVWMQAGKLANWLEAYAEAQECNVWLESTVDPSKSRWLSGEGKWEVTVLRGVERKPRTMKVGHIIMATGLGGGKPKMPPKVPGQDEWEGKIVHSSGHKGGREWKDKRVLVVGACTSGHDISVDFSNCGADTTMLQRSPTFIMTIKNGLPLLDGGLYKEEVLETMSMDTADRIADSLPKQVGKLFHQRIVNHLSEADKDILDGLKKAGFKTWKGPEGTGWLFLAYERAGGYYFTAGENSGSQKIIRGEIKVRQGEIASFGPGKTINFKDGSQGEYDLVVFATGYSGIQDSTREVLGDEAAEQMGPVWGLDSELEVNGVARRSGIPNTFFTVGNFMMSRWFSRRIALQIVAEREGKWGESYLKSQ